MTRQDYLQGSWRRLPRHCLLRSLDDLKGYAYEYKMDCNPDAHSCALEDDSCRGCAGALPLQESQNAALSAGGSGLLRTCALPGAASARQCARQLALQQVACAPRQPARGRP